MKGSVHIVSDERADRRDNRRMRSIDAPDHIFVIRGHASDEDDGVTVILITVLFLAPKKSSSARSNGKRVRMQVG